jgi:hemoglobin
MRRHSMNKREFLKGACGTAAAWAVGGVVVTAPAGAVETTGKSLYERLGGVVGIAAVVDDFVNNLLKNKVVTANAKVVESLGPKMIRVPALKFHATAQVCAAAGGPEKYTGRSMLEAHKGMNITEKEWQATVEELIKSLNRFKVPEKEQHELIAAIAPSKPDIVGK